VHARRLVTVPVAGVFALLPCFCAHLKFVLPAMPRSPSFFNSCPRSPSFSVSPYNHGIMGYRTPNIDRLVKEGTIFTE
jgi:hypothetical protein